MTQRLLLGGDVNLNRPEPASAWQHLADLLSQADVRFANLEGPLAGTSGDSQQPDILYKPGWTHSAPAMVDGLTAAGIDGVSCANNVTFPAAAMLASLAVLDQAGIGHCGAGADLASASRPLIIRRGLVSYGFLAATSIAFPYGHAAAAQSPGVVVLRASTSYTPDPRVSEVPGRPPTVVTTAVPADLAAMAGAVADLRAQADVVVLSCHWGIPGPRPLAYQQQIAHAAIGSGADIVLGHGPHSVQAIELYRDRPVFYSLGNLVFDWTSMRGRYLDGLVVLAETGGGRVTGFTAQLVRRDQDNNPRPACGEVAEAALDELVATSAELGTRLRAAGPGQVSLSW